MRTTRTLVTTAALSIAALTGGDPAGAVVEPHTSPGVPAVIGLVAGATGYDHPTCPGRSCSGGALEGLVAGSIGNLG